jgi:hypothetical protein
MSQPDETTFEKAASETRDVGFLAELWRSLNMTKKWWLAPPAPSQYLPALQPCDYSLFA